MYQAKKYLDKKSILILSLLLLVLAVGCGDSGGDDPEKSSKDAGVECVSHAECGEGKICQENKCEDRPIGYCEKKEECTVGEECINNSCQKIIKCRNDNDCKDKPLKGCNTTSGKCEWECAVDEHCSKGFCNFEDKKCEDGTRCKADADCKDQENKGCNVTSGKCAWECSVDQHCTGGKCHPYEHTCIFGEKCLNDADCATMPLMGCNTKSGKCEWECTEGKHCPSGNCDQEKHLCNKLVECKSDNDCKDQPKKACDPAQKKCLWECSNNAMCKGVTCNLKTHECQTEVICKSDNDCANMKFKVCNGTTGKCEWECRDDAGCLSGVCDKTSHMCKTGVTCKADMDCQGSAKKGCNPATSQCEWECSNGSHCSSGKCDLVSHTCHTAKTCAKDDDCKGETKLGCNTTTKRCEWDCNLDSHCTNGTCNPTTHNCRPEKGCSDCKADEFCFNKDFCAPRPFACNDDNDCSTQQKCLTMVEKKYCWNQCDTTKNISTDDQRNPSCYGGMGWCLPYDDTDTSKGVCVFSVANIRTKNQKCLHGVPFEDSWHACESDYTCVKVSQYSNDAFCWNNCDVNKTGAFGLNPDCDSGQGKCVELISVSGQTPVGACEPLREKKNAKDAKCNTGYDPSKPEYFDCAAGLTCHYSKCAEERKPVCNELDQCEGSSPTAADWCKCKPGFICLNHTCAKERTLTQKEGQRCDTLNFGKPDYNSCEAGLKCIKNSCLKTCDPTLTPPACGKEQICQKLAGGAANAGVCQNISLLTCKRDPSDVNKSDCPANFYCFKFNWSYNCVKSCDPSSTAPGCVQDYTCRPFDINDAKKGYCIPDRLNNYNRLNDTCHSSDPLDLDYHGCEPPYECVSSNCREPLPKTQGQGEVCDTSSKGCQAGLICLLPGRDYTAQDICMKQCNPYQSGQCDSGEVCQVEQENKFYWSAGCYKERKEILDNGSQCKCTDPTKPCYDLCKPNLTCHKYVDEYSTCVVECDPAQNDVNTGLNSVCQTDETCDKYKNCLKLINSTQPTGQQCKMKDPRLPTYHDCQTGNYCVEFGDSSNPDNWCHQTCDPINPQCSAGYVCANAETDEYCANDADCAVGQKCLLGEDSYYKVCHVNICQKIRQNTQKEFQKCQTTDSTKPEYNDCEAGFVCSGYQYKSTKDKYCLKKCQVGGTGCATGFACSSFSYSGDNVCIQSCTQKAECINYGSECERAYGSQYVCH